MEELDTTTSSSSSTATPCKVPRICDSEERRRRMQSVFPLQSKYNKSTVSMGRKLVKKAQNTRQKMESSHNRRQRHFQILEQLCQDTKDDRNCDDGKKEEFEEPPPRPPTRRCMFYRDDTEVVKVLRAKQF